MIKKINLRGISEILSEKELKNVMGGSDGSCAGIGIHQCSGSCPDVIAYWTSDNIPVYRPGVCKDVGGCMCV